MAVEEFGDALAEELHSFSCWRQGDKFELPLVPHLEATGEIGTLTTPDGVALVSQTCDAVLPDRANVQVAPIITLPGDSAREARQGKRSRFAHLPRLGIDQFVDLDHVSTVSKSVLRDKRVGPGVMGDEEVRRLASAVARRFGRFAFPNDVSDAMKTLRDVVQSKAVKSASPLGKAMKEVLELRAEARPWRDENSEVALIFVLAPGSLPTLADDDPGPVPEAVERLQVTAPKGRLSEIAAVINSEGPLSAYEKFWLWQLFADTAAELCERAAQRSSATGPTFVGEVVSADEFPLTRVRRSEIVDLDHLSTPFPLEASTT